MSTLEGKVAVVTGGGRGVGRSVCAKLSQAGASLVVNDLDEQPATEFCEEARSNGSHAIACAGDVCAQDFPRRLVEETEKAFGRVDIIVNNAGYVWNGPFDRMSDEQWDAMQAVHLRAPFRILRAFHKLLASPRSDEMAMRKVVNVSSISATRGASGQAAYAAAKAGLHGLTRALAREWGPMGVNVNCVALGFVRTRLTQEVSQETTIDVAGAKRRVGLSKGAIDRIIAQTALGRAATPDEAAGTIAFFCGPESDFVTGQVLEVSGGLAN